MRTKNKIESIVHKFDTDPLIQLIQKDTPQNFELQYYKVFNILKKTFVSTSILIHQISNIQVTVEIDVSDYNLTAILLIIIEEKEVYSVTFHFYIFKAVELNYNIHDKELLTIYEAFHTQCYYLEGLELFINIIIDYKNLEYFSTTKILSYY